MRRFILSTILILVLLAAGFTLVVNHRAQLLDGGGAEPGSEVESQSQSQSQPQSETEPQVLPQPIGLEGLSKEQLESLIVAAGQNAIKTAIRAVSPAVAQVTVTIEQEIFNPFERFFSDPWFKRFFGEIPFPERRIERGIGSGFLIEYQGRHYLLTNNHVVEGATSINVLFPDGQQFAAEVIGRDEELDVAVLRLRGEVEGVPPAKLGDSSKLEIGDWVVAIGNPIGLQHTVTAGIISALERRVPRPDGKGYFSHMIQTDAAINPGNSGGPLVNALGEVVGINTAIAAGTEGINFAIAIDWVEQILPQLIEKGRVVRVWLGIYIAELTPDLADYFGLRPREGVLVNDVVKGAPAEGVLRRGDVVLRVDGQPVHTTDELQQAIMFREVGEKVKLEILRDNQRMEVEVTLGERPSQEELGLWPEREEGPVPRPKAEEGLKRFGLTVEENSPEMAQRLGLVTSQGVVITAVEPGSSAYWAGLEPGDVILEVNRRPIDSLAEWNELVSQIDPGEMVLLTVLDRRGIARFLTLSD